MPRVGTGGAGGAGCAGCADDSGGFGGTGSSVGVGGACGGMVSKGRSWKLVGLSGSGGSANVGSCLCLDFACGFAPSRLALVVPFMTTSSPAAAVGSVGVVVGSIDGEGCTDGSDCTDDSDCTDGWLCTGTGSALVVDIWMGGQVLVGKGRVGRPTFNRPRSGKPHIWWELFTIP